MRSVIRRVGWGLAALVITGAAASVALAWNAGYRIYVVHTGSMTPTLKPGDAVLDRPAPTSVHSGQVVTFAVHSGPDRVVTHRVASVSDGQIHTKGDANRSADPWALHLSQVVGSKVLTLPNVGYLLVYLQHPQGIASVLTAVVALVLLWQLFFPAAPSSSGRPSRSREPRHKRELAHDEKPNTSPALILPAPPWLDGYRTPPSGPRQQPWAGRTTSESPRLLRMTGEQFKR